MLRDFIAVDGVGAEITITIQNLLAGMYHAVVAEVIGKHLGKDWLTLVEPSVVQGPDQGFEWQRVDSPTNVYIVREIDHLAVSCCWASPPRKR